MSLSLELEWMDDSPTSTQGNEGRGERERKRGEREREREGRGGERGILKISSVVQCHIIKRLPVYATWLDFN